MTNDGTPNALLATTNDELDTALAEARANHRTIAFVPTMGALHEGHLSLIERARSLADIVVVSIFVNPKQFGANEDFDRYPRTLETDLAAIGDKADLVFAPTVDQIYPPDQTVPAQSAGPVGNTFEGKARPGHFDGMLTVVARLFYLVRPDVAVFGEKDAQQLFLIRRLAASHYPNLRIIGADTVREANGVARSSRNRYLNAEQFEIAEILPLTLATLDHKLREGFPPSAALELGRAMIEPEPETKLDYLALVDPASFEPVGEDFSGEALLIVAAIIGGVRLIDNHQVSIP